MQHNSQNTHSISGYIVALYALIKGKHFLSLTGFHKRRNCSKSDMQKFLLFCHRLRLRHKRLVHLIPSFLFFALSTMDAHSMLTICIRRTPRHANRFKMCIGFLLGQSYMFILVATLLLICCSAFLFHSIGGYFVSRRKWRRGMTLPLQLQMIC